MIVVSQGTVEVTTTGAEGVDGELIPDDCAGAGVVVAPIVVSVTTGTVVVTVHNPVSQGTVTVVSQGTVVVMTTGPSPVEEGAGGAAVVDSG